LKGADRVRDEAAALRLTARDLGVLGVCDRIVPEPLGGAHRDRQAVMDLVSAAIAAMLGEMEDMSAADLIRARRTKFLAMGSKGLSG